MSLEPRIKTVIAGTGASGLGIHTPLLQSLPDFEIVGYYSRTQPQNWNSARLHSTDWKDLLRSSAGDVAVIATPPSSHFTLAAQALEEGYHVVVEKPFTLGSLAGRELLKVAQRAGRVLSVFHNRRWDSDFLLIKGLLEAQKLGTLVTSEWRHEAHRPGIRSKLWKETDESEGGLLEDLGSHFLDQALVLFGEPLELTAFEESQRPGSRVGDAFQLRLKYPDHTLWIHASMMVPQPGPRYKVVGTTASLIKYGEDPQEGQLKQGILPGNECWGKEKADSSARLIHHTFSSHREEILSSPQGDYALFYKKLLPALRGGILAEDVLPPVSGKEALKVIELIEAARKSIKEKSTVILGTTGSGEDGPR